MTVVNANLKIAAVAASASVMLIFAEVTLSILIPALVGVALIMMGLAMAYRPPAVVGALTVLATSALAIDISTLTDLQGLFIAVVALYIPLTLMTWAALSAEPGDAYTLRLRAKTSGRLVVIAVTCVLSVPVFALVLGVLIPGVSMRMSTMTEMSVLLVAASAMALLLARSSPDAPVVDSEQVRPAE